MGRWEGRTGCETPGDKDQEERTSCRQTRRRKNGAVGCLAFPHRRNRTSALPDGRIKHPRALTCFSKHIILTSPNHLPTPPPTIWPSIAHINIYWVKAKSRHYGVWFNNKHCKIKADFPYMLYQKLLMHSFTHVDREICPWPPSQ